MSAYQHTQSTYVVLIWMNVVFVAVIAVMAVVGAAMIAIVSSVIAFAALSALVFAFSRLTACVDGQSVSAWFAWGWPRRTIALDDIVAVRAVRNPWYYGWGLRKVRHGWMYNVWGLDAVEIERVNGKVFRIGTDQPIELSEALSGALAARSR